MDYPIGIQSFEKIRREDFVYVDKTGLVYQLVRKPGYYFLSRPRRFGKSLLVSTLEAYFSGQKELFAGLKIAELETEWKEYPIFKMSFSSEDYYSVDVLKAKLNLMLTQWERLYGNDEAESSLSERFQGVIHRACDKCKLGAVILIDEYDKPLLQNIKNEDLQDGLRKTMKAFFGALKDQDKYIRFGFITGVTRFSHVSLFSDLNNLDDITLSEEFEAICGVTKTELHDYFTESIAELAKKNSITPDETVAELTRLYDGYHFSIGMTDVFNPFSLLKTFKHKVFDSYWFESATPSFLLPALESSRAKITDFEGAKMAASGIKNIDAMNVDPKPLLFQAGYLTIKDYDPKRRLYTLGFPNQEVRGGFFDFLLPYCTEVLPTDVPNIIFSLIDAIAVADINTFMRIMKGFFSGNTYELFTRQPIEQYYQTVFYCVTKLLGIQTQAEMHTSCGRVDMLLTTDTDIFIFEFKLNLSADAAINQIEDRHYADQFTADVRKIHVIGVNFDPTTRSIKDWKVMG